MRAKAIATLPLGESGQRHHQCQGDALTLGSPAALLFAQCLASPLPPPAPGSPASSSSSDVSTWVSLSPARGGFVTSPGGSQYLSMSHHTGQQTPHEVSGHDGTGFTVPHHSAKGKEPVTPTSSLQPLAGGPPVHHDQGHDVLMSRPSTEASKSKSPIAEARLKVDLRRRPPTKPGEKPVYLKKDGTPRAKSGYPAGRYKGRKPWNANIQFDANGEHPAGRKTGRKDGPGIPGVTVNKDGTLRKKLGRKPRYTRPAGGASQSQPHSSLPDLNL